MLEKMKKMAEYDIDEFGTLDSSERTIAILGYRWWPQTPKQEANTRSKKFPCSTWLQRGRQEMSTPPGATGVFLRQPNLRNDSSALPLQLR